MLETHQVLQSWQHPRMVDERHKYLAAWRNSRKLSGKQLAAKLGTTKPTISRLETGRMGPKLDWWLGKLAAFYGCEPDDLLEPPPAPVPAEAPETYSEAPAINGDKEADMTVLRPIVQTLVEHFGFEAVVKEASRVDKGKAAAPVRPSRPPRTS